MIPHDPFDLRAHVPSAPAARPTPAAQQVPARPGARHPRIPCPGASSWSERAPALTSLVAACGGRGDPLARHGASAAGTAGAIIVSSQRYYSNEIIAEL